MSFVRSLAISAAAIVASAQIVLGTAPVFASANPNASQKNTNGVAHSNKNQTEAQEVANAQVQTQTNTNNGQDKYRICHRTASYHNPYVSITVARAAVDGVAGNSGNQADHYGEHQGPVFTSSLPKHTEWGDIIPPVEGAHNGYNWTTAGQAIYNNDCKPATPSPTTPGTNNDQDKEKVTLCHATGSKTHPYVRITVSAAGAFNGHLGHQDGRDIIPTFTYQGKQYSQNWDAAGQAIYNNNCHDCKPGQGQGQGSGPTTPTTPITPQNTTPATPATPASKPTTPVAAQLANTGSNVLVTTIVSLLVIGTSVALGLMTRRKLAA